MRSYYWQPQVCGMPVQTPPFGAASLFVAGALKTDNCLSTFLLAHLGQQFFHGPTRRRFQNDRRSSGSCIRISAFALPLLEILNSKFKSSHTRAASRVLLWSWGLWRRRARDFPLGSAPVTSLPSHNRANRQDAFCCWLAAAFCARPSRAGSALQYRIP